MDPPGPPSRPCDRASVAVDLPTAREDQHEAVREPAGSTVVRSGTGAIGMRTEILRLWGKSFVPERGHSRGIFTGSRGSGVGAGQAELAPEGKLRPVAVVRL